MHFGPGPSWQLSITDPFDLFFALYVREAVGIPGPPDVPVLAAPVPAVPLAWTEGQRAACGDQWSRWWSSLVTDRWQGSADTGPDGPDFAATVGAPELQAAQRVFFRPALAWRRSSRLGDWSMGPRVSMVPTELVHEIEREIGRRAHPFRYWIEVLPVREALVRDLSTTRLLLSESIATDFDALRAVLRPRLEPLA